MSGWGCFTFRDSPRSASPARRSPSAWRSPSQPRSTLAPAMLAILGGAIFWPFRPPRNLSEAGDEADFSERGLGGRFWFRVADLVVSHPGSILGVCLVALAPLAVIGARTHASHNQLADLDADRTSVIGANMVKRYFAVGELSPAVVLVDNPRIDFNSDAGRQALDGSQRTSGPSRKRRRGSVAGPSLGETGSPQNAARFFSAARPQHVESSLGCSLCQRHPMMPTDRNHIARLDVVFKTDPFSTASLHSLNRVYQSVFELTAAGQPLAGTVRIGITGSTAAVRDLTLVTASDQRRMYLLVTLGVYAILVALLRRPGISLYLIATVVLGYLASLGLTDLVFRALSQGTQSVERPGLDRRLFSVRDPGRGRRGLQHLSDVPGRRGRAGARDDRGGRGARSPTPEGSSARAA